MPTYIIDDDYDITASIRGKEGAEYVAVGRIFRRRTGEAVGVEVSGKGRSMPAALRNTADKARQVRETFASPAAGDTGSSLSTMPLTASDTR